MKDNLLNLITKLLYYSVLIVAIGYVIIYIILFFFHIQYPFELMWQEGASVDHVKRIVDGYKYYVPPSLEFVPSIYTPLYFYISALVSKIIGIGFVPLRLVSFIASICSFIMIYLIVKRESNNIIAGILAFCLFASTYALSGAWFDIGRPDSLFLFFLLTGIYVLRYSKLTLLTSIFAGFLFSLSFYTKQTALPIVLPIILFMFLIDQRCFLSFTITLIICIGIGSLVLDYVHNGWFSFYVYELPITTPVFTRHLISFWTKDILSPLFIACFIAIFYLIYCFYNKRRKEFLFYTLLTLGMIGASWYSRLRGGGFSNVLFPAYAIISILFGLGINQLLHLSRDFSKIKQNLILSIIYLICIFQFGNMIYNPFNLIPSKKDLEAGKILIKKFKNIDGEIFSPFHGYLTVMAGKKSYANQMGMRDILKTTSKRHTKIREQFIAELTHAIRQKMFDAIIIDSFEPWYPPEMEKYYEKKERIFNDEDVFFPITGMKTRPEFIYVPKK